MPILPDNPFKGRQYPGDVILMAVRWYLRYPLAYEHVAELLAERGLAVDRSCVWRWVQAYAPEINKRCRPHLKPTNKNYRVDETWLWCKWESGIKGVFLSLSWQEVLVLTRPERAARDPAWMLFVCPAY
jgi:hypothetical protein